MNSDARIRMAALILAAVAGAWLLVGKAASDPARPAGDPPLPDVTTLRVAISSPANHATVWGVVEIAAVATEAGSDAAGVQFLIDGSQLGLEVDQPPFRLSWNTTTAPPGGHTLTAIARDQTGGSRTSNPVNVTVTTAPSRLLKKSINGRHLVDPSGAPFLIAGDAPQALTVNCSTNEADFYFADRQAHGFNTLWVNLLCNDGTAGRNDGSTYDGIQPFTGYLAGHAGDPNYYDLGQINTNFFARCDWMIRQAAQYGLVILLDPAETIGWLRNNGVNGVLLNNGTNACRAYGQFLGDRYKDFDNIIWMSGNDFQTWRNPAADAVVLAVAQGIQSADTNHLHTVELDYLSSGSLDDPNWWPLLSLNASYSYYPTYAQVLKDYNRTNFLPVLMVEANYEFESLQGPVTTAPILRRQEYWTLLSGGCGQMYGSLYTWRFPSGWQTFLDSPGALQMPFLKYLFEPRPWYNLLPDQDHSVLTAGFGTFAADGYVADNTYATCARTSDGRLIIAYMPTLRAITIDLTKLAGPATARWYDPSSGTYLAIIGSPLPNTGSRTFTPPGSNGDGDGDWVLVLETDPPRPVITAAALIDGDCVISFTTLHGLNYDLDNTTNLTNGVWSSTLTNIPGTGGIMQATHFGAASQPVRFYRIKQSP